MNACFDNIVSLREYCTEETSVSDIYLNDIGLNKDQIEQLITGDYATVKSLVENTISMSIKEITAEIYGHFSNRIQTASAIESGIVGVPPSSSYTTVTGGDYRGIYLSLKNGANYLNFELAAVSLFLDHSGVVNVLVYDLDQNKLLETIPVTAVAGQIVEVYPNSIYESGMKSLNLWIGYDATAIDSYKTLTRSSVCCGNYGRKTTYLQANGTSLTGDFITANLEYLQDTAGVGVRYSIWCDSYAWMCTYARLLALPIAYKTASELYRRGLMVSPNTRTNNSTTTNTDLLTANFNWHESKYRESMDRILKNIHLPSTSVCFQCKSPVTNAIILP